jgi:hypothetical protein
MAINGLIFVTFHALPAVYALNANDGTVASSNVIVTASDDTEVAGAKKTAQLDELRGIYLDASSGSLIVIAGGKAVSKVYVCPPSSNSSTVPSFGPPQDLITKKTANSIDHPFAAAFDGNGNCYVSNQDSNVVSGFTVTIAPPKATANAVPKHLTKHYMGTFLEGTLAASAVSDLPGVSPSPPAVKGSDGGLGVSMGPDTSKSGEITYKVQNSVRDVVWVNDLLLVVDEPGGVVRIYDPTDGHYLGASTVAGAPGAILGSPTHLLVTNSALWVSFANQIYSSPLPTTAAPSLTFSPFFSIAAGTISGMAVDSSNDLYIANRTMKTVEMYPPNTTTPMWTAPMPDQPEFLLFFPT